MIVTICGAYRNSGDHLIGARGRALVRRFVDPDVITLDRKAISPADYEVMNRASAVLLCGGPAYQKEIYPKIYPLDLDRVKTKVIPFGLGWKAPVGMDPSRFAFAPAAQTFVTRVHDGITESSVRDPLTWQVIRNHGIPNVRMTGCPAWYSLDHLENGYRHKPEPKSIVLSMPAVMQPGVQELMEWLTRRFPKARRTVSFHHGLVPSFDRKGLKKAGHFLAFSARAIRQGWRVESLAGSLPKMEALYGAADLHIGYRVHAHLLCLSQRTASILVNEDIRGEGQARALGQVPLSVNGGDVAPIIAEIESHYSSRGEAVERAVETMRATFGEMHSFLQTIR